MTEFIPTLHYLTQILLFSQEKSRIKDDGLQNSHSHPLYVETAEQLGLLDDQPIPPLISHPLPA